MKSIQAFKSAATLLATISVSAHPAFADENGTEILQPYLCAKNEVSSLISVCKEVAKYMSGVICPTETTSCVRAQQEVFTGLTGEPATPANIKRWNGQGGSGDIFQSVGVCLMRDLAFTPMKSKAKAMLPIGSISAEGLVGYTSFTSTTREFRGYHRLRASAPVIGEIDIMTQPFSARAVSSNTAGQNKKAGEYALYGAHALEFEADGGKEKFDFKLDAIKIVTPYGVVSPQPYVGFARTSGWSLSPYGGASKMQLDPGAIQMTDVYGRSKGLNVASALEVSEFKLGKYSGARICTDFGSGTGCLWPKPTGWDSQILLGSRSVDPNTVPWTAPVGVEFPSRPDANTAAARGPAEKIPGGFATAGVNVNYSPTELIPEAIRNSSFITITFNVFANPNISVSYASQFNFWNGQAGAWNPLLTPPSLPNEPPTAVTPVDVESLHTMGIYSGTSVAGRFAIDSGVDLVLNLHIPLPWPLEDIDFNIINAHPRTPFLETMDVGDDRSKQQALVISDWQHFIKTAQPFKLFSPLGSGPVDGVAYVQKCLAETPPPENQPGPPTYTPGNPEVLTDVLDLPCNICVGQPEFTYVDLKTRVPPVFVTKVMKGHAEKVQYVDDSVLAPTDRWVCGGSLPAPVGVMVAAPEMLPENVKTEDEANKYNKWAAEKAAKGFKNLGCYDQCRVNKETGKFELVTSATQLFLQGILKDAPNGCY